MKKSPLKKHLDKSKSQSKSKLMASSTLSQNISSVYFCHYKNAMYMGGIKAFKKQGKGILLHDNGISAITSYVNDQFHGHNIFFDNYSLLSAIFNKNKITQCAYRTQGFLVFLTYNNEKQLQGKSILMNYITKTIIYSIFKKGNLVDKSQQTDQIIINKVFGLGQIDFLIGRIHAKVIKYQFQRIPGIQLQKQGNRFIFGFQKHGFINGLGFSYIFRGSHGGYNIDTHRTEDNFQLKLVQRGYFINTQLYGMGQKMFKNGNVYIGQFKNSIFEGHGILKNSQKNNWVSGIFKDGNLIQLTQYKGQGQQKAYIKIIQSMHQRKTNWINNQITLWDSHMFIDQIEKIIKTNPNKQTRTLQERKQEVLKKIQEKFISQINNSFDEEINQSLSTLKKAGNQTLGNSSQSYGNSLNQHESSSLRKKVLIDHDGSSISFKQNSPPRAFVKTSGKANLYDKSEQDKIINRGKSQPLHQSHKKRVTQSPAIIKGSNFGSSGKKQYSYYFNHPLFSNDNSQRGGNSKPSKRGFTQGNSIPLSSDRNGYDNRPVLDSKKLVAKNKIFKYIQQQQSSTFPKFAYTEIDRKIQQYPPSISRKRQQF